MLLIFCFGICFPCEKDTCQTQLMLETAISQGQQDASAEHIDFVLNTK